MISLKHKILNNVKDDLVEIEAAIRENLTPQLDTVSQVAGHILFSGGKRLRPLLMVLCARLCGYDGTEDKKFAAIFEYLHVATLLHDDLVDSASLRRGKPVANSIWSNSVAVLTGDFLLARSLSIGTETGKLQVIHAIARVTEEMSQGEIHQLIRKGHLTLSESEYMEVIRRKTAVLIRGACHVGAIIADASVSEEAALTDYGFHIGMAFQMADDLLDYTADTQTLGKEIGADLKEGKLTLPVIYALEKSEPADRSQMEHIIQNENFSVQEFEKLVNLLEHYGGLAYTRKKAEDHILAAKHALADFTASKAKDVLMDIADYVLARDV